MLQLNLLCFFSLHFIVSFSIVESVNPYPTMPIISFCVGQYHACAVFNTKQTKCLGKADSIGTFSDIGAASDKIPFFNPGNSLSITQVTCSLNGFCVLLNTGSVKCVGNNNYGQTGLGSQSISPVGAKTGQVADKLPLVKLGVGVTVTSLVGGSYFYCILTTTRKVKCFGRNNFGQLGYNDPRDRGSSPSDMDDNLKYLDFGANTEVISVHSGSTANHNCVILSEPTIYNQRIKCWGHNNVNQLGYGAIYYDENRGDGVEEMGGLLPWVDFGTESRVKQIAIGSLHTCALLVNNILKCFGEASNGQLGLGLAAPFTSTGNNLPYVLIDPGKTIKLISAGNLHTCIVYDDMVSMKCFGANENGQLGQGDANNRGDTPTTIVPNITTIDLGAEKQNISSIHSGPSNNYVTFTDGSIKRFGDHIGDQSGEMGNNLFYVVLFRNTPAPTLPTPSPSKIPSNSPTQSPTKLSDSQIMQNLTIGLVVTIPIVLVLSLAIFIGWRMNKSKKRKDQPNNLITAQEVNIYHANVEVKDIPVATVIDGKSKR